ncbi:ABC transporter ATP-binding protein [Roseovarius sp. 2305UL8-3]|uniref:ABC transporter ATP-binding protein n=1 Tax=Roseovarius conchicola TaxID=3121636 RepID=UPI00352870AD
MEPSCIKVTGLKKSYWVHQRKEGFRQSLKSLLHRPKTEVEAVKDISFSIGSGEIVGFLGPNGAGKTTTLKALSGLLYPTSGSIKVLGHTPQARDHDFLRQITLVMGQKQQLIWDLSAADSFQLNKVIYDIPEQRYLDTLGRLTEMLGIGDVLYKPQRSLSLGERMKCELAAAMLHSPKVLFLDEPTIGMDINVQQNVRQFVADYRSEFGATVLLTSHYMADVTALADQILVIDEGRLIFEGNDRDLTQQFSNTKLLSLQFATPIGTEALAEYGDIKHINGLKAEIYVDRDAISSISARLLNDLPVADISIAEVPFEDVLGQLFNTARDGS